MDSLYFKEQKVAKDTILLSPGQVANVGYRVQSGCLQSYVIDPSGKKHTLQFAPEDWFISDLESFTKLSPSKIFISALEDSQVFIISRDAFPSFEAMSKETLVEMSSKMRNNLIATNNRLISLLSSTAEERYLEFIQTYPNLIQRLPLKLIASYLGMTPEHLSYTRGKLARKS
ncbi:MAG: Crp/Fnr family transcriptional regulator [Bacteroidia bacterium]